jgi:hypothetical protein
MDKTLAGVLGAITALAVTQGEVAHAAAPPPDRAMQPSSYADLLAPIPNALALLTAEPTPAEAATPSAEPVQYYYRRHHHHHHHHHHWWRHRFWRHGRWHYYR